MFKKMYCLVIALVMALIPFVFDGVDVFCASDNTSSTQTELETTVDEQLSKLDIEKLNEFFEKYCDDKLQIWGSDSLSDKLHKIISGDFSSDTGSFANAFVNVLLSELVEFLPLISSIIAIAVLASLITELKAGSKSVGDIVHFVCFGVVITIILSAALKMISLTSFVLGLLTTQMEIVFPLLLTLLTAVGGTVSVAVYQPAVALLTTVVSKIFSAVLLPIFIFALIFTIISNISNQIKVDKFAGFLSTLFKWIVGIVFTVFMGFLAVKGITAGSIDTVSFKTAKYSLSTYIPMVGGYLSEGLNLIVASCVLIKNAIGVSGILIMFTSVLLPLLQLVLFMFALKFTGAVLQPLSDSRISNFITSVSKVFIMPIVMVLAVAFMYVIFVGLIMCTSVGV